MSLLEKIEKGEVYIIAEMSANHAGNLENAIEIIHEAKNAGADCLKIQTYTPDTMTIPCNNEYFCINGGLWHGSTLYDLYRNAYTPWEWHTIIRDECKKVDLDFLSTPFDTTAVDFLEEVGVDFYKISSFELVDIPLIEYVAAKGKPIIMSCGMASTEEIEEAIEAACSKGNNNVVLLKCCSEYPANYADMNLSTITDMKKRFSLPVGISDHSFGSMGAVVAVSLGACVVEKHFCISREIENPDCKFSMEPNEFARMVKDVHIAKRTLGEVSYNISECEKSSLVFRRSIFAVKDIEKGDKFNKDNIKIIRPGYGLKPKHYNDLLELKCSKPIKKGEPILFDCIQKGVVLFLTNNNISLDVYNWLKNREDVFLYKEQVTLDFIKTFRPSFIVSYNYKYLISKEVIEYMNNKIINLHTSLLPWNKGAYPNFFSFYNNTPKGVTIHVVDEGIDTGDIFCQKEINFDENMESFESSYIKLNDEIQELFYMNWEDIKNGKITPQKQQVEGSYHTTSQLKKIQFIWPFCWNENISKYKERIEVINI